MHRERPRAPGARPDPGMPADIVGRVRGPSSAGRLVLSVASALVAALAACGGHTPLIGGWREIHVEALTGSNEAVRALLRTRKELL